MKKFFLPVFFVLVSGSVLAQRQLSSGHFFRGVEFGYTTFRPYQMNDFLFGLDATTRFTNLMTVGVSSGGGISETRSADLEGALALNFFIPQEIVVTPDTLKYRAGGWELMTSAFGIDVFRSVKTVDLAVAPGIFWGSMRIRKYNSTGNFKANELFKNPFIAPMIRAELRFVFGPVAIGSRFSYRYDITKSKWKKGSSVVMPGYKCEELQYLVYIGWVFEHKK